MNKTALAYGKVPGDVGGAMTSPVHAVAPESMARLLQTELGQLDWLSELADPASQSMPGRSPLP